MYFFCNKLKSHTNDYLRERISGNFQFEICRSIEKTFELLVEMGLIEPTMCKVAVIRNFVNNQVESGVGKLDAMWSATEHFACTYEYVRRCMYYYRDMNFI